MGCKCRRAFGSIGISRYMGVFGTRVSLPSHKCINQRYEWGFKREDMVGIILRFHVALSSPRPCRGSPILNGYASDAVAGRRRRYES